jgi:hypothetical protein
MVLDFMYLYFKKLYTKLSFFYMQFIENISQYYRFPFWKIGQKPHFETAKMSVLATSLNVLRFIIKPKSWLESYKILYSLETSDCLAPIFLKKCIISILLSMKSKLPLGGYLCIILYLDILGCQPNYWHKIRFNFFCTLTSYKCSFLPKKIMPKILNEIFQCLLVAQELYFSVFKYRSQQEWGYNALLLSCSWFVLQEQIKQ